MLNHVIHRIRGESVAHSGVSVSVRDLVCLLLVLLLLLYSCYNCYRQWKKNYQLPPGDFVAFKGKEYGCRRRRIRVKRSCSKSRLHISQCYCYVKSHNAGHLVPEEVKMDEENERTPFRVVASTQQRIKQEIHQGIHQGIQRWTHQEIHRGKHEDEQDCSCRLKVSSLLSPLRQEVSI